MILGISQDFLEDKESLIISCMEKNVDVHVIEISHICSTEMTLEQFLIQSSSTPIKCVVIEDNMRHEVYKINKTIKAKSGKFMFIWCPNCHQKTFPFHSKRTMNSIQFVKTDNVYKENKIIFNCSSGLYRVKNLFR